MRGFAILVLVGVILSCGYVMAQLPSWGDSGGSSIPDSLSLPQSNAPGSPAAIERATVLGVSQAMIGYQDLKSAGIIAGSYVYAKNVTLPSGPAGSFELSGVSGDLFEEVEIVSLKCYEYYEATLAANPPLNSLDDYANIYNTWDSYPIGIEGWRTDVHFARLRLTYFPLYIQKLTGALPSFVPSTSSYSHSTLNTHLAAGSLYFVNYDAVLADVAPSNAHCIASYALFTSHSGTLMPVGILIAGLWYSPADGDAWLYAKIVTNCVDANIQPLNHFMETHLALAPVSIDAERQLYYDHPVRAVTARPREYGLALTAVGFQGLFNPSTAYDLFSSWGYLAMHNLTNRDWSRYTYAQRHFDSDIISRGVQNLPGYQWRDDLTLYENAFETYATGFVDIYYPTDATVAADYELQAWAAEASNVEFANVFGFPSSFTTRAQVIDFITHTLLMVIRHHALSWRSYGSVELTLPYAPWNLELPPPTTVAAKSAITEASILANYFPTLAVAAQQVSHTCGFVRNVRTSYFQLYASMIPVGTRDAVIRAELVAALTAIHNTIASRPVDGQILPFVLLDPAIIPSSGFV